MKRSYYQEVGWVELAKPNNSLITWWRRRESNPRPKIFHCSFYIHSLCFKFAPESSQRQDFSGAILFSFRLFHPRKMKSAILSK